MNNFAKFSAATAVFVSLTYPAQAQDVVVNHFDWFVQHDKMSIIEKTIKEANTPEGQAIISAVAAYVGIDPKTTSIALAAAASFKPPAQQQDMSGLIQTPPGYTICFARPSNPNPGAGDKGIETHGDTTFNGTIVRVIPGYNFDGLAWYMVVPTTAGGDHRVATSFDVVTVKADPGWQNRYKNCEPTGEHAWLARNNETHLNVPCSHGEGAWCPN